MRLQLDFTLKDLAIFFLPFRIEILARSGLFRIVAICVYWLLEVAVKSEIGIGLRNLMRMVTIDDEFNNKFRDSRFFDDAGCFWKFWQFRRYEVVVSQNFTLQLIVIKVCGIVQK